MPTSDIGLAAEDNGSSSNANAMSKTSHQQRRLIGVLKLFVDSFCKGKFQHMQSSLQNEMTEEIENALVDISNRMKECILQINQLKTQKLRADEIFPDLMEYLRGEGVFDEYVRSHLRQYLSSMKEQFSIELLDTQTKLRKLLQASEGKIVLVRDAVEHLTVHTEKLQEAFTADLKKISHDLHLKTQGCEDLVRKKIDEAGVRVDACLHEMLHEREEMRKEMQREADVI
jgi:hypothetical protein